MDTLSIPIETLYSKTKSMYKLVVLASMRALQLNTEIAELTQEQKRDVLETALQEIAEEKVTYTKAGKA